MNLLEKAKLIASTYDETIVGPMSFSPSICRALVEAMEEIEKEAFERNENCDCDADGCFIDGMLEALSILRVYLEVEK